MNGNRSTTLLESEIYALLSHPQRRLLLRILQDFATPISAAEVAELIADCEAGSATDVDRRTALLSLYHNHLPRLHGAGVVDYDSDRGTVRTGANFGVLLGVLTEHSEEDGSFPG